MFKASLLLVLLGILSGNSFALLPPGLGGKAIGGLPFLCIIKHIEENLLVKQCLGCLISNQFLITTGSCANGILGNLLAQCDSDGGSQDFNILNSVIHPDLDIGLLQLLGGSSSSSGLVPLNIGSILPGQSATALSFVDNILNILPLNILGNGDCGDLLPNLPGIGGNQVCTDGSEGIDPCGLTDPLLVLNQVGALGGFLQGGGSASAEHGCGQSPLSILPVQPLLNWILNIVGPDLDDLVPLQSIG